MWAWTWFPCITFLDPTHSDAYEFSRTPLDEWSALSHRHLPENTQYLQGADIPPARFEIIIPASEHPQTHALDRAVAEIGELCIYR
jgi:hypothetical protein